MRNLLRSTMPDRKTLIDPTKHLEDSLNTNNVSRIKSAINMPCVNLNVRIQKHQQMTILMRFCYMDISVKSRKDLANLVLKFDDFQGLNAQDLTGKTALMHACIQQDKSMIELLTENEMIDPDIQDNEGDTALMHACRTGDPNVVETLIMCFRGVQLNINVTNNNGMSPLLEAARLGYTSVIRVLVIDGDADVTLRDKDRNSALNYLVTSGKGSTPDFLLICPAAQRKRMARQRRIAEGRKSMLDLIKEASVTPRTAWADEPKTNKQKHIKNGGIFVVQGQSPVSSLTSKLPFTRDYTGQLNSVVFQMAQCVPMLIEKPFEEEAEDIERTNSRMKERRRSSSLPDLKEFHESILGKYLAESLDIGRTESETELSSKKPHVSRHGRRQTFPHGDGRLRLKPLSKDDSARPECDSPRASVQRRGSLPNDIHLFSPKDQQLDQKVQSIQTGRRGSLPLSDDEIKYGSKSSLDSSPRKLKSTPVKNEKADRPKSNCTRNQNSRRRSSLPLLNTNNKSVLSASASSASSTWCRRSNNTDQRKSNSSDSVVYRPRVVESRVTTSWEGKSSKTIPSYLFR